jgi:hypothetical protein
MRRNNGLIQIVKTLILCSRQNIPLRGNRDNATLKFKDGIPILKQDDYKLGNFNSLLLFRMDAGDDLLKEQLEKSNKYSIHTTASPKTFCLKYQEN